MAANNKASKDLFDKEAAKVTKDIQETNAPRLKVISQTPYMIKPPAGDKEGEKKEEKK